MDESQVDKSIADIRKRLRIVEHEHEILEILNGLVRGDRDKGTPGLKSIVYGSKELGVKPLRKELEELNEKMDHILTIEGRVRWLLGILGVTGLAGAISLIIVVRQLLGI